METDRNREESVDWNANWIGEVCGEFEKHPRRLFEEPVSLERSELNSLGYGNYNVSPRVFFLRA